MRSLVVALLTSACGGAATIPATPVVPVAGVATSGLPRADFVVVPAELADEGVLTRIPHRVRIRRLGLSWMREEGESSKRERGSSDVDFVLPAINENATKVRVVFEDDSGRFAIWIPRTDVWDTVAAPLELSDRDGKASPDAGIWVARGAPLLVETAVEGTQRGVQVRDSVLALHGFVADRALVKVWIAGAGDPAATLSASHDSAWHFPDDKRPHVLFAAKTKLRASAKADAPAIAVVDSQEIKGFVAAELGEFRHIEIVRPHARIKGFVLASEVTITTDNFGAFGTGGRGHGFGMSHADKIDVPVGTCLFDRVGGEVIGVQSELSTRLGVAKLTPDPTWSMVHASTHWGILKVYLHNTSDDPKVPVWEPCTQPVRR